MTKQYEQPGVFMSDKACQQQSSGFCNLDYLLVNLGRNEATAMRLVALFLQNYPVLSERMTLALEAEDHIALRDVLHDIRSSCVLFSGHHCVGLAKKFEDSVRDHLDNTGDGDARSGWKTMADALLDCMHCMASELKAFLANRQK